MLTSAKSRPFSIVLITSLPAVRAAAQTCSFSQTPRAPTRKGKSTFQAAVAMRGRSLCQAGKQTACFLLRTQPHDDRRVYSCEAHIFTHGGRSSAQSQRSPGKPPAPALRRTAPPTALVSAQKLAAVFWGQNIPRMGTWLNKLSFYFWTDYASDGRRGGGGEDLS